MKLGHASLSMRSTVIVVLLLCSWLLSSGISVVIAQEFVVAAEVPGETYLWRIRSITSVSAGLTLTVFVDIQYSWNVEQYGYEGLEVIQKYETILIDTSGLTAAPLELTISIPETLGQAVGQQLPGRGEAYGTVSIEFDVPPEARSGTYTLQASLLSGWWNPSNILGLTVGDALDTDTTSTLRDHDGDGIDDDEDLCMLTKGVRSLGGCPDRGPAAGDLVFRYGVPSKVGGWIPFSSFSEGSYNFGHVGVFAGDFKADQSYEVRHKDGIYVWRGTPDEPALKIVHLKKGERVRPGDVVPNAVIEASIDYGGVTISSLDNFKADNTRLGGNEAVLQVGAPLGGLGIDQRKKIVEKMSQFAADTDAGKLGFEMFNNNCALTAMMAYSEAGYNLWGKVPEGGWFSFFGLFGKTVTPNLLASWMGPLWGMDKPRSGVVEPAGQDFKVSILAESPVEIHIYDSAGRHTGPVEDGCQAQIPYTEYWQLENDYKLLNILAKAEDTYRLRVESYDEGSFDLYVLSFSYFQEEQGHLLAYEGVAIGPLTIADVTLTPNRSPDEDEYGLQVDRNGDGQTVLVEKPRIESFTLGGGTSTATSTTTDMTIDWTTGTDGDGGGGSYLAGLIVLVLVVTAVLYVRRRASVRKLSTAPPAVAPAATVAYCENCGRQIPAGTTYCPYCGDKQGV